MSLLGEENGLKICFKIMPKSWEIYVQENNQWRKRAVRTVTEMKTSHYFLLSDIKYLLPSINSGQRYLGCLIWAWRSTVSHDVLLQRLRTKFGITRTELSWITSFLRDHTQQVFHKQCLSGLLRLLFGVPQGSVLDTIVFFLYLSQSFDVVAMSLNLDPLATRMQSQTKLNSTDYKT